LQLALGHAARFAQLANTLADILDRLLVDKLFGRLVQRLLPPEVPVEESGTPSAEVRRARTAAISSARPVLDETTCLTADDFPIHF